MKSFSCVKHCFSLAILSFGFFYGQFVFAAEAIGQVIWVRGSVQAIGENNQMRTLERRSPIYEKDTIVTGASGSGQIAFTDNSTVDLESNTRFRIDQYKFNSGSPKGGAYVAGLAKGGFRTITGLISKGNPEGYQVNTPVATIGVRGTQYRAYYDLSRGLSVKLEVGKVIVSNAAGSIVLDAKTRAYATVKGLHSAPVGTNTPVPMGGAMTTTPKGPAKSVKGFCVE